MLEQAIELLKLKIGNKLFFGSLTSKFEAGKLMHIVEIQSHKPFKAKG